MSASEQETTKNDLSLIFSYGTLKRGFQNHVLMEELKAKADASFKGVYTTMEAFPLVIGPFGIPFLINKPGSGHQITGELYSVTGRGLARLDELEGIETGHYERLPVKVVADGGEVLAVEAYFAHRSFAEELWRKCGEVGVSEYSMEMGNKYVKRSNRPLGSTFVSEVLASKQPEVLVTCPSQSSFTNFLEESKFNGGMIHKDCRRRIIFQPGVLILG